MDVVSSDWSPNINCYETAAFFHFYLFKCTILYMGTPSRVLAFITLKSIPIAIMHRWLSRSVTHKKFKCTKKMHLRRFQRFFPILCSIWTLKPHSGLIIFNNVMQKQSKNLIRCRCRGHRLYKMDEISRTAMNPKNYKKITT